MKATFHITKIMKNTDGSIRKIGSMERIMTVGLATEMLQKKIGEFFIKKNDVLETVLAIKTEKGPILQSFLNNKKTTTLETLPTYR